MIPLISSLCYGPLGVCQLPRTWWKVLTRNAEIMDEEYPDFSDGLDRRVFGVLGLDRETTLKWLRDQMPTYLEFEGWILKEKGSEFYGFEQQDAIVKWNAWVRARRHTRPKKIEETYSDIGLPKDAGIDSAVILNCLQDWQLFYRRDLNSDYAGKLGGRVVPLIATLDYGPLGVRQLPRTWFKIILRAKGLLHPDYPDMTENGLDPRVLHVLNLDFESWVLEQCRGELPSRGVEEWNDYLCNRIHDEGKREDIHAPVGRENDGALSSAVVLNHIEDWHLAHRDLVG